MPEPQVVHWNFAQINQPNNNEEEPMGNGKVLDTVGAELESLGLDREGVLPNLMKKLPDYVRDNFKIYRDGSSEMFSYTIQVRNKSKRDMEFINFNSHTPESRLLFGGKVSRSVSGYELVSKPLSIEDMELTLKILLPTLESAGDFISDRCATHIHVGMSKRFPVVKRLLKLGLWADELFYAISGMGTKFRGYSNNAIYARPLVNGPYFRMGSYYYQTLNWEKALQTDNLKDFFSCYAIDTEREAIKYHPARYFSINLYSILLHGTIEFRHFNQSFDPDLVVSIAKLCQLFSEIGIKAKDEQLSDLEPGNPFVLKSHRLYMNKLYDLIYLGRMLGCKYNIGSKEISKLGSIIDTYNGIGIPDVAVLTHTKDLNFDTDIVQRGELKRTREKPIPDGHTDIHNIKLASIIGREVK